MSRTQNENYDLIAGRLNSIEQKLSESDNYGAIRRELIEIRASLKGLDLHPNAVKKIHGWTTNLFRRVNENEKNFVFSLFSVIEQRIAGLEQDPLQRENMKTLWDQVDSVVSWCAAQQKLLSNKSGRSHTVNNQELVSAQSKISGLQARLDAIQQQRTALFQSSLQEFENDLARIRNSIDALDSASQQSDFDGVFNALKEIQNRAKQLPIAKRKRYWQEISELFEQVKEIRKDKRTAGNQLESQQNFSRFNQGIDEIEDVLSQDVIPNNQLKQLRNKLFQEIWNPLKENDANNRYKIFLIRSSRNELFDRMKTILEQIDQRQQVNHQYAQECGENLQYINGSIEKLFDHLQECRQGTESNFSMKDREILEKLNSIMVDIKACHRHLKTGHFFMKDRRACQTNLSRIWADTEALIQSIVKPEFSFEWLADKIKKNDELGGLFVTIIPNVPRP